MAENLGVICACGYTTFVKGSDLGSSIACLNCGAELEVDESSVAVVRPSEDAAPLDGDYDQGLPESPLVVNSPFDAQADEDPASPFEHETEHGDIRAREELQPPNPARARSPFEEDEQEEEETPRSGPFSLEPAPEAKDASFQELMEAERPKESNRHVIIENESPLDKKTGEKCTGCGREIRGDWDRFETGDGVLCYVCSNQGTHALPDRVRTDHGAHERAEPKVLFPNESPVEQPEPPWYMNPKSDGFRRLLFTLAFGTIGLALFVSIFNIGTPSPEALERARIEAVENSENLEIPLIAKIFIWSWRIISLYIGFFMAFYLALGHNNRLPHETFKENAAYIGLVLLVLTGIQAVTIFLYAVIGEIFVAGVIWGMLLSALSGLIQIQVVMRMLDYGFRDFFWTIIYLMFSQFILQSIGQFLYAGIFRLVT